MAIWADGEGAPLRVAPGSDDHVSGLHAASGCCDTGEVHPRELFLPCARKLLGGGVPQRHLGALLNESRCVHV